MSDYKKYYKDKTARRGRNSYERNLNSKQREFDLFFKNALTKDYCLINGVRDELIFQDHSQSNNKDLSDDKYVVAKNSTDIGIGDYIVWQNSNWLVFTEEYKTIPTHQQLKIKAVNDTIKWIDETGKICNSEKGWGAYVQSQTLYTMGVSVGNNIAAVDSKMMMYMQNNSDTRKLKPNTRVFVGYKVYKMKFIDPISRPGLISYLLDEDTIGEYDNVELAVADYYRNYSDNPEIDEDQKELPELLGEICPKINSTQVYRLSNDKYKVEEWTVESLGGEDTGVYMLDHAEHSVTLQFKNDFRYVGTKLNIIAKLDNNEYISISTSISARF